MTTPSADDWSASIDGSRARFLIADDDLVYLDGNSLGRMPLAARQVLADAATEWSDGLVRSWHDWIELPRRLGELIAPIVGAGSDEVLVCDQTSLNLFKLASAAVGPDRPDIVTDTTNFPSDIYVLRSVAESAGGRLRLVEVDDIAGPTVSDLAPHVDERVGLVSTSHVAFKSAAIADLAAISALAHDHGALTLFDLSHSVGAIPIELERVGADLAVGCTYKHLNGGPGSPAFLYVRRSHHGRLLQPVHGWWSHDAMFDFATDYVPAPDVRRFLTGTPAVLSMRVAEPGIAMIAEVGIDAIRERGVVLGDLLEDGWRTSLEPLGYTLGSPTGAANRGHHLSLRHPEAYRIAQTLIARKVIPDFRAPDNLRLGISPLYQRPADIERGVAAMADVVRTRDYEGIDPHRSTVT